MRFRTKVFTLFLLIAGLSSLLVVAFLYWPTKKIFFNLMRNNVLSVAATAAAMIDPEQHDRIKTRADQDTPDYDNIERLLRRARDANRRHMLDLNMEIKFLYTMRPYSRDSKSAEFVVDAEEDGIHKSNVGEVYIPKNPNYIIRFNEFQADDEFIPDQWGTWITATAPIRNAEGNSVGVVGADIAATDALRSFHGLLWTATLAVGLSLIVAYILASISANRITRPLMTIRNALDRITAGDLNQNLNITSRDEFGEVAASLDKMIVGLQQREDLKNALTRYVSEDVLHDVIYAGKASDLFSSRRKVTTLFADVRGFTHFSEQVSPEETVGLLNDYFEKMIEAVFKNKGNLNKFMGDGLMALFGALRDDDFQEEHALQAALDMRQALVELKEKWGDGEGKKAALLSELRIGIGINTGLAIVGNIGSKQRMDFTAIGDSVNVASRLESATRQHNVDILVSEYTFVAARSRFPFEYVGDIPVKGKSESLRIYTLKIDA